MSGNASLAESHARVPASQASPQALHVALLSDLGLVSECNQDAVLAFHFVVAQRGEVPLPIGLFVMADGLGGHAQGEEASALAARQAADHLVRTLCLPLLTEGQEAAAHTPINELLETATHLAHDVLLHRFPEARTTLTIALVLGEGVYLAHAGDTRAYLGTPGGLRLLTRDHSMAARLLEMGQPAAGEVLDQRRVLYKAVGQGPSVEPDLGYHALPADGYLLLCTDGLWSQVDDDEMAREVGEAPSIADACRRLVALARERGGDDNISILLAAGRWPLQALPSAGSGGATSAT
jgi:serine/threonine protein phosphatase PrpC